jgi:hypothetical protein
MKTAMRVFIFAFMVGIILGATESALLYGSETGQGNAWDFVLDTKPFPGIILAGPLSIYYELSYDEYGPCGASDYLATMYYTVRLSKHRQLYTFQGKYEGVCLADIETQGTVIKDNFLGGVVVPGIFETYKSWKLKSIDNAQFNDDAVSRAFVADIEIAVKENPKPRR